MSASENPFWSNIRKRLRSASAAHKMALTLASVGFPIIEGVLVNRWTGGSADALYSLILISLAHVLCFVFVLINDAASTPDVAAQAFENHESIGVLRAELRRRTEAYRLTREAMDQLGNASCTLTFGEDEQWARAGYESGLRPIVHTLVERSDLILGVPSSRLSLYVASIGGYTRSAAGYHDPHEPLHIDYHFGRDCQLPPSFARTDLKCLPAYCINATPTGTGDAHDVPILCCGANAKPGFQRFAWAHIFRPCSTEISGVICVATSGDEAFPDDVTDTLKFFGTILGAYNAKFLEYLPRQLAQRIPKTLSVMDSAEVTPAELTQREGTTSYEGANGNMSLHYYDGAWQLTKKRGLRAKWWSRVGLYPEGDYKSDEHGVLQVKAAV